METTCMQIIIMPVPSCNALALIELYRFSNVSLIAD